VGCFRRGAPTAHAWTVSGGSPGVSWSVCTDEEGDLELLLRDISGVRGTDEVFSEVTAAKKSLPQLVAVTKLKKTGVKNKLAAILECVNFVVVFFFPVCVFIIVTCVVAQH
jgi:hypothetical protein